MSNSMLKDIGLTDTDRRMPTLRQNPWRHREIFY
jgi:hypothetical protein